jgi:FAD/FMN-containing dehydrogenase
MSVHPLASVDGVELSLEPGARELFAQDIYARAGSPVAAVARPRSLEALQALVARAADTGTPLTPRGGGMSYTRGYVADRRISSSSTCAHSMPSSASMPTITSRSCSRA